MQTKKYLLLFAAILFFSSVSFAQNSNCNKNRGSKSRVEVYKGAAPLSSSQKEEIINEIAEIDPDIQIRFRQAGVPSIVVFLDRAIIEDDPDELELIEQLIRDLLAGYGYN